MKLSAWAGAGRFVTARGAGIMIVALALAWLSAATAASEAFGTRAPRFLAWAAPGEIQARLRPFDNLLKKNPGLLFGGKLPKAAVEQSRFVLARVPLHAGAIRWLGMDRYSQRDKKGGDLLVGLSNRVTRRNASVQLLLANDAAKRGDAAGAFRHLDLLIRTHGEQGPVLFPQMAAFLADAQFRNSFVPYIRNRAPWIADFFVTAIQDGKNPAPIAETIAAAGGVPHNDEYRRMEGLLLSQLVETGAFGSVQRLAATFPSGIRQQLAQSSFNAATTSPDYAPLSWRAYENAESGASFIMADKSRRAALVSSTGRGTTKVLDRLFFLKPGSYRLTTRGRAESATVADSAHWRVACTGREGAVLFSGNGNLLNRDTIAQVFDFAVPDGCDSVYVELHVKAGSVNGLEFYLTEVSMRPVGG